VRPLPPFVFYTTPKGNNPWTCISGPDFASTISTSKEGRDRAQEDTPTASFDADFIPRAAGCRYELLDGWAGFGIGGKPQCCLGFGPRRRFNWLATESPLRQ